MKSEIQTIKCTNLKIAIEDFLIKGSNIFNQIVDFDIFLLEEINVHTSVHCRRE